MLVKFSGVESRRIISKFRKRKNIFVFTYFMKRKHEIKTFHVGVMQPWLRNIQKGMMHMWSCCFVKIYLLLFTSLVIVDVVVLAPYCCDPKILLPWKHHITLLLSIVVKTNTVKTFAKLHELQLWINILVKFLQFWLHHSIYILFTKRCWYKSIIICLCPYLLV